MKRIIVAVVAAAMMLSATNASAQYVAGGGFVNSTFSGKDNYLDLSLPGFYVGVGYDIAFSSLEGLTFEPGAYFMHFGKKVSSSIAGFVIDEKSYHSNYISIPLDIKYSYEITPVIKVTGYTGPRFNIGLGGNAFKKVEKGGLGLSLFDAQWGFGVSGTYADAVRLSLGYDLGMSKVSKENSDFKMRRNSLHVGVAFLF